MSNFYGCDFFSRWNKFHQNFCLRIGSSFNDIRVRSCWQINKGRDVFDGIMMRPHAPRITLIAYNYDNGLRWSWMLHIFPSIKLIECFSLSFYIILLHPQSEAAAHNANKLAKLFCVCIYFNLLIESLRNQTVPVSIASSIKMIRMCLMHM